MTLAGLLGVIAEDPELNRALDFAREAAGALDSARAAGGGGDLVAPPALRPFIAAVLAGERGRGKPVGQPDSTEAESPGLVLAVTATGREADDLTAALSSLLPPRAVACFPAWETLPHERLSPRSDTVGQRLAVLYRLAHPAEVQAGAGPLRVVVAPVRSVLQPLVAGLGDIEPIRLAPGEDADLDEVVTRLVEAGYTRADLVEKRGDIAVRGGILDVFPPTQEHPLRVEFFGDTVEEIRYFKVADQRSLTVAEDGLWAPPCRELLLTPAVRDAAKRLAAEHPSLADVLGKLADGDPVEGMEAFAPVLAERMELLLDHIRPGARVLACDPERIRARAVELVRTSKEFLDASWVNAAAGGEAPIDLGAAAFRPLEVIRAAADRLGLAWWTVAPFADQPVDTGDADGSGGRTPVPPETALREPFRINAKPSESYRGDSERALGDVRDWLAGGWRVVLVTEGHGPAQRLAEVLRDGGLGARLADLPDPSAPPEPGVPYVTTGLIERGFVWPAVRTAVLTESDLAGQRASTKDMRRLPARRRAGVDPLQLRAGDYVVHEQHGVGRYVEMTSRTIHGATREYLVIEYAPGKRGQPPDRLYVPTDQLDEVTRYVGG
ncbi:MAG: CarD family transcriptional regulator, partial [Micromonosporaceae bacterium]